MIAYRSRRIYPFQKLVIVNGDGTCRKIHSYPNAFVDVRWVDDSTYLIYCRPEIITVDEIWVRISRPSKEGSYLIRLDEENQIVAIQPY